MNVGAWLEALGLADYEEAFAENGVDAELLRELTNEDLKDLGVARLADRKRLLKAIAQLAEEGSEYSVRDLSAAVLEGERRQVTVLFTDLAAFTELSAQIDPEELHDLLTRLYEVADEIVEGYDGTVDKHLGDGIMALFGAPRAHSDDPLRAVRAAFDIHSAMTELSVEAGRDLSVHAGIASGEVVAGGLGRDGHQEYTVLGDSVNLASRLDGLANAGDTLIADSVQRAVSGEIECESLGDVPVKGLDRPVRVWRARGIRGTDTPHRSTPFVGRRGELKQFSGILDECSEQRTGQTVLVRGEAGIGKTRLLEEFVKVSIAKGFNAHKGLVLDFGVGKGQDAIGALLRSLLGVAGDGDAEPAAAAEAAIKAKWIEEDQRVYINDLLDLAKPTELRAMYDAMDEAARNRGKQNVVVSVVKSVCGLRATLLVIEDSHWADASTLDYLAQLMNAVCDHPAVLVMTTRVEGDPFDSIWRSLTRGSPLVTLDLSPLRQDEALKLASGLTDAKQRVVQRCIERAEGNPLFLEQLVRNAEETEDESIPASVQSLVLARMDRLPARDKGALQAASVLGQRFTLDTLRHLIGDPAYICVGLTDQSLIRPEGDDYLFNHALIQEGVYNSLLKRRRRTLHLQAADWFSERDPMLRAEHLDRAGDPAAPSAYLEAAQVQTDNYHYEQAVSFIERGLALATKPADKFALKCLQGQVLHDQGSIDLSSQVYSGALELAEDDNGRCRAWIGWAAGLRVADRYDEALALLDKAETVAERDGLIREQAEIHHIRGNLYFPMGRIEACAEEHGKSLRFATESGSPEAEANALSGLADASYIAGRMASAYRYFDRCVGVAHQNGFGRIEVANRSMVGFSRFYLNHLREALDDALESAAAASKVGHQRAEMLGDILAAFVLYEMAEYRRARQHNERALALSQQLGAPRFEAQALMYNGKLARAEGHRDEAIIILKEAQEMSGEVGHGFSGPRIAGELARNLHDEQAKRAALVDGERMLAAGSVAHNHFFFYPDAIEVSLDIHDWDGAERYATALEDFCVDEPLPWCDFFVNRGRILAACGRGERQRGLVADLERLRDEANKVGLATALPALDEALSSSG